MARCGCWNRAQWRDEGGGNFFGWLTGDFGHHAALRPGVLIETVPAKCADAASRRTVTAATIQRTTRIHPPLRTPAFNTDAFTARRPDRGLLTQHFMPPERRGCGGFIDEPGRADPTLHRRRRLLTGERRTVTWPAPIRSS